jgi:hypothetical protein
VRILVFGTVYCDTEEKRALADLWGRFHREINPGCDLLLVDSCSPYFVGGVPVLQLGDNIGHLARGGRDGWGRAFCAGLRYAIDHGYDYVAHVEGDSLLRRSVTSVAEEMRSAGIRVISVPVRGTRRLEIDWVETGLMMFCVDYLRRSNFTGRYDWRDCEPKRRYPYTPEWHVHRIVSREDDRLVMMPWRAERGDRGQITLENVGQYDWITHAAPDVCDAFVRNATAVPA